MSETEDTNTSPTEDMAGFGEIENRYVAFCDILGFSNRIVSDFDRTLEIYKEFGQSMSKMPASAVQITMYSDAILITARELDKILIATQSLLFVALSHQLMVRGAITRGKYWEQRIDNHFLVASDALVRAVKLEKSIGIPAVVIADDVEIPDHFWLVRYLQGVFITPLLHFRDRNIVNPFGLYWFRSAAIRAQQLMDASPSHKDKYLWFLALHKAVEQQEELMPHAVLQRLIDAGLLRKRSQPEEQPPGSVV